MAVDALGYPLRWQLTGAEVHDITQAPALIAGLEAAQVIADKSYDSNAFIATLEAAGAQVVIPPRRTRACSPAPMSVMLTVNAISLSACSTVSNSSVASPHAMTSSHATSYPC